MEFLKKLELYDLIILYNFINIAHSENLYLYNACSRIIYILLKIHGIFSQKREIKKQTVELIFASSSYGGTEVSLFDPLKDP